MYKYKLAFNDLNFQYKELKDELDSVYIHLDTMQFFEYLEIIFSGNSKSEEIIKNTIVKTLVSGKKK